MTLTRPVFPDITLDTSALDFSIAESNDASGIVLLVPAGNRSALDQTPWADFLRERLTAFPQAANPVVLSLPGGQRAAIAFVDNGIAAFRALSLARKLIKPVLDERFQSIRVISLLEDAASAATMAEALIAATHAALFTPPRLTEKAPESAPLRQITLMGEIGDADISHALATAEGNNLARWLTLLPGNYLTPAIYRAYAESLAQEEGWDAEFIDLDQLEAMGAGAFVSVAAASPNRDAGILHLKYRPGSNSNAALAIVGKGICFDTGGTNLKVGPGMLGMHGDMQGSAVALGTFLALTRIGFNRPVDCWLALAENHIGPHAVKCNDVITALDGTTIELINTDAEGRMVLADTLTLVSREKPVAILDYATLTGGIVAALGNRMAGAITNRRDWIEPIIRSGESAGERVWPFPYEDDYDEDLKSLVADTLQCRTQPAGDHIYAARFLGRFVDSRIGWVHVDMASSGTHKGGLAQIPTDIQGYGVRFGVEWLMTLTAMDKTRSKDTTA